MRDITSGFQTVLETGIKRWVIFYEGEFVDGTLYFWTGIGEKSWNGHTWEGAGLFLGISEIIEAATLRADGVRVSLSGMSTDVKQKVLAQARHGQSGKLWLGFLDSAGAIIADPYQSFSGRLDVPKIKDDGAPAGCTVSISYENRLISFLRPRVRRYTHEDQQIDHPGDLGFEYVPSLQDQKLLW